MRVYTQPDIHEAEREIFKKLDGLEELTGIIRNTAEDMGPGIVARQLGGIFAKKIYEICEELYRMICSAGAPENEGNRIPHLRDIGKARNGKNDRAPEAEHKVSIPPVLIDVARRISDIRGSISKNSENGDIETMKNLLDLLEVAFNSVCADYREELGGVLSEIGDRIDNIKRKISGIYCH